MITVNATARVCLRVTVNARLSFRIRPGAKSRASVSLRLWLGPALGLGLGLALCYGYS